MPGRLWTEEELCYLKQNFQNTEYMHLADNLDRSLPSIHMKCSELGLTKLKRWTKDETDIISSLYTKMSYSSIGELIGRSRTSIALYVSKFLEKYDRSGKTRKVPVKDNYFKTWSSSMAYILGYATADGCIVKNTGPDYCGFQFYLNKRDKEFTEFVVNEICPGQHICESGNFVCLRIMSKGIVEDLYDLGVMAQKTGFETLPEIPEDFKWDYLRGLIDGDGWISFSETNRVIGLCCASESFLVDIKKFYGGFGSNINTQHGIYRWDVRKISDIIYLASKLYYDGHPFSLSRKRIKCEQLVQLLKQKEPRFLVSTLV